MGKILELKKPEPAEGYLVYEFPQWGAAVWGIAEARWVSVIISTPGGGPQDVDVSGIAVVLHENGIEFGGKA